MQLKIAASERLIIRFIIAKRRETRKFPRKQERFREIQTYAPLDNIRYGYRTINLMRTEEPAVRLESRDLNSLKFLIDSGSGLNIIKKRFLKSNVLLKRNEILKLTGITAHHVSTLGIGRF